MNLIKKLEEIQAHFENITEEEFEANLKEMGIDEIKPCSELGVTMLTEEQKKRFVRLFKDDIFPVIKENEVAFNEMHKKARKFLDEFKVEESQ